MAELYHMHTKGIRDDKWKEKKEIIINDNFINRLGKRCYEFNACVSNNSFPNICEEINTLLNNLGYESFSNMPMYMVIDHILHTSIDKDTLISLLTELKKLTYDAAILKREMAMEQYRKDNKSNLPSRLHCIYATDEKGISYWKNRLLDGNIDLYRIETIDKPFKTSEIFIPDESYTFKGIYDNSYHYWNPKLKNISDDSCEYLISGKVKILEKVDEFRR